MLERERERERAIFLENFFFSYFLYCTNKSVNDAIKPKPTWKHISNPSSVLTEKVNKAHII